MTTSISVSPVAAGHHVAGIDGDLTLQMIREGLCAPHPVNHERRVVLETDGIALHPGDRRGHVLLVHSGVLRMHQIESEGRRHILALFGPGELVGISPTDRSGCSLEASTTCVLHRFERRSFESASARNTELRQLVLRQQDQRLERLRFLTWMLCALRPFERISAFLCMGTHLLPTHSAVDGSLHLRLALPRTDMADLLGTSVETISRVTQQLHRDGVIEIMDPTHFRIPDLRTLMSLGQVDNRVFSVLGLRAPLASVAVGAAIH